MNQNVINNFVVIDSIYGKFIVNRHCHFQAEALIKTGKTHIEKELEAIFLIIDRLPEGSIILDGGVNIGFFSIPVSKRIRSKNGKVIGFEPQKPIFHAAGGSIALNDIDNCYLYNLGLSDEPGIAELPNVDYSTSSDFGMVSIDDKNTSTLKDYLNSKDVETISIDRLNLQRLDFIKLDIEGHEIKALNGGISTIRMFRPFIWIEYAMVGAESIKETLKSIENYSFLIADWQNMVCVPNERALAMGLVINPVS